jgi:DNA-binding NtrC family response regulator
VPYIDDLPQLLEVRKATLESHGYSVNTASHSQAALRVLQETSVAVVLLEKQDSMDAEAGGCHIKQRFPNLPILLVSAYADMPERILWRVDEYVMKSELPHGLVQILKRFHRNRAGVAARLPSLGNQFSIPIPRPSAVLRAGFLVKK